MHFKMKASFIVRSVIVILYCTFKSTNGQEDETTEFPATTTTMSPETPLLNVTFEDKENEILPNRQSTNENDILLKDLTIEPGIFQWVAPYDIRKNFPYYLAGFDFDDKPVWICEIGKYNIRKIVEERRTDVYDIFVKQAALRMVQSHKIRDKNNHQIAMILDFEGLRLHQIASVESVAYVLKLAASYRILLEDHVAYVIIVNANFVTEQVINLVKPIFGRVLEHVQVFPANRARWLPVLRRYFPKSTLPEYLGGSKDFSPIAVYG